MIGSLQSEVVQLVFVKLAGVEMPARPDYYGLAEGPAHELGGKHDRGALASKVSDASATLRAAHRRRLDVASTSEEEEEDSDENNEEEAEALL